jgi:formate hydrogenlyase transcriptional activator
VSSAPIVALEPSYPEPPTTDFDDVIRKPLSTMSELELQRLVSDLRASTVNLQSLVEARTAALRASEERQRVLLDVNNAIVTCLDRDSLFSATAAALRGVIPFDRAALILYDSVKDVFKILGVAGPVPSPPVIPLGTEWPRQGSRAGWVLDHKTPLVTADLRNALRFVEHGPLLKEGIRAAVSVPMTIKGRILGTLNVGSRAPGRYGPHDASLLAAIAEQVALAIENLLAYEEIAALKARLEEEKVYLQEEARTEAAFGDVVGESPAILAALENVRKVARTDSTVLVTGETGTGKELIVRAIHTLSRRKDKLLVKVNCAALPASLIESELFGHERGAFTGALTRKVGRFELASAGTLFLDEIGELPLELQAKLLRVLQDGEFERVGGTQTLKMDVRLIAATNRDLEKAVSEERFRADL